MSSIETETKIEPSGERKVIVRVAEGERLRCGNCGKVCALELKGSTTIQCRRNLCRTVNYFISRGSALPYE